VTQHEGSSEHTFGSTSWRWKLVKVAGPPEAKGQRAAHSRGFRRLPRWPMRQPLHLTIKYRGGPEAWVEIHSRGEIARFPGSTCIFDVLCHIANNG
jgi:hypothetical protein